VKLLETRPALILMDELVNYIVGAAGIPVGDATLKDQTISFLQQLTSAVAQTAKSVLLLTIRDDGTGGADPARGSGLIGITDRVDALGGTLEVSSPAGQGTSLRITLPLRES